MMKPVTLGAAAVASSATPDLYAMDLASIQLFGAGLVEGLIMKDNLPEMQKCLGDAEAIAPEVQKIANELAKGDMSDIVQGIKDAIDLVKKIPTEYDECKNVQDDLTKLKKWQDEFTSASGEAKIVENVMMNWSTIQSDIGTINQDMQQGQYVEAGDTAADVVILALGKIEHPAPSVAYLY